METLTYQEAWVEANKLRGYDWRVWSRWPVDGEAAGKKTAPDWSRWIDAKERDRDAKFIAIGKAYR